jgi:hypothetical protein
MRYSFQVEAVISMNVEVDADSFEDAVEMAQGAPVMSLCWQCARGDKGCWNTSGELDADPAEAKLVSVITDDGYDDEDALAQAKLLW